MNVSRIAVVVLTGAACIGCAEIPRDRVSSVQAQIAPSTGLTKAAAHLGRDGQDPNHHCSPDDKNVEYRECVNAWTRDPNAKIRLG